ncbi:ferric reductase like transmembrane component-domain-containing protein [Rostrohypoxylon terebratum]|nr:ferric reductase like transmembrane component-domain-containing protein [Rostrohypoxylon terebratum]
MGDMDMDMDMSMASPTAPCVAENAAFLTTLAYCINSTCQEDNVPAWKIEKYWADQATGDPTVLPQWTYGAALANITQAPTEIWTSDQVLNYTALISRSDFEYQITFDNLFDWEEHTQSTYVIVIVLIGVGTPVLTYLLRQLPYMTQVADKIKPYLIYPSTVGTYVIRPIPGLPGNAPTMGQGLYIGMFVALNIVLGAVSYKGFDQPHPWGFTHPGEIMAYVGYRTGHIAFALLPLTVLFSSRNNILLWLTDWPYSTFLVLHRWVARVCALQAVVHSITLLGAYISTGGYATDVHMPYWIWGIVATLCLVILLFQSLLWFRTRSYEVFLILHILLSVFVVAGCWYHVMYWAGFTGIYEYWLYAVSAVWFFDRLMRALRVFKNGIREGTVVEISADIVRVDIKGVRWAPEASHHVYAYFPSLSPYRPWENHPFSIVHTSMLHPQLLHPRGTDGIADKGVVTSTNVASKEMEEGVSKPPSSHQDDPSEPSACASPPATDGISMYIKRHTGSTKYLRAPANPTTTTTTTTIPVLLDGPYRGNASAQILKCDRVLLIGGGIGVTGLLAWTDKHPNVKLAWSVRAAAAPLVVDLGAALARVADKLVLVGERLDVSALLAHEVSAGWERVGVVVCGPGGLCDDVRQAVVTFGRREKTVFELEVDAFTW